MNNGGGAWDNAKKIVEVDLKQKGTDLHAATVVGYRVGDPFKWNAFSSAGVSTGIFIGYVVLNWKYLAETVNAALGRLGKDRLAEFDRTEPTSYRNSWGLFALGAILVLALRGPKLGAVAAALIVAHRVRGIEHLFQLCHT
jgi:hypothetical protein